MIAELLGPAVTVVTSVDLGLDDEAALAALDPREEALVRTAVPRRRGEFAAARACAHEALRRVGAPDEPVLRGDRGMPVWPHGFVGTLAHCTGMRVAAVAPRSLVRSVGVDVEPVGDLPRGVLASVSLPAEARWVEQRGVADPGTCWDRLLFTTKEAIYKAWFPVTRRWLGFQDAEVELTVDRAGAGSPAVRTGGFDARILLAPGPATADGGPQPTLLSGRWAVGEGLVASAVVLPPS